MALILIPDYPGQQVISGARALSRAGDVCDIAWHLSRLDRIFRSGHIRHMHALPPASLDDAKYAAGIVALCQEYDYDLILPFGNDAYYAVVSHAQTLSQYVRFMAPDPETFSIAYDKAKTAAFCREIGIDVPRTFEDFAESDLPAIAGELRYPVVIKARSGSGVGKGLRYANSEQELLRKYEELAVLSAGGRALDYRPPIIQEFVPGFIHDACTLTNRGKVVNVLTQIRWVMYPIYGGVGAVNVTTHNRDVDRLARKLLEAVGWHGPAQIEFKYDPRDRRYKLIEVNPKLWGTLDLSIKAGMNFPRMIRDFLMGERVAHGQTYPANVRYVFMFPQATYAYLQLLREFGFKGLHDPGNYEHTYYDLDKADVWPDLARGVRILIGALVGKVNNATSNLDKRLVNRMLDKA